MLHTRIRCSKSLQKHSLPPPPGILQSPLCFLSYLSLEAHQQALFSVLELVTRERNGIQKFDG